MNKLTNANSASHVSCSHSVCLEFTCQWANEVCIAGSFNDWHPAVTPMICVGDGKWIIQLVLPPGRYAYRLVVDGQWLDDPAAKETVPNPLGGVNAVLVVTKSADKRAKRETARAKPSSPGAVL
jgi:1,4-alpha-glucan branching enzyme